MMKIKRMKNKNTYHFLKQVYQILKEYIFKKDIIKSFLNRIKIESNKIILKKSTYLQLIKELVNLF